MKATATLISVTPMAEQLIARARWVCRRSEREGRADDPEQVKKAIKSCLVTGHLTPLEFAHAIFEINCTRACSHQVVRHRTFAFCQESQRGTDTGGVDQDRAAADTMPTYFDDAEFDDLFLQVSQHYGNADRLYHLLTTLGVKKEDARYVLTSMSPTRIWMVANFRNWMHFLRLRLHPSAQEEVRSFAQQAQAQLEVIAPNVFSYEALSSMVYAPALPKRVSDEEEPSLN